VTPSSLGTQNLFGVTKSFKKTSDVVLPPKNTSSNDDGSSSSDEDEDQQQHQRTQGNGKTNGDLDSNGDEDDEDNGHNVVETQDLQGLVSRGSEAVMRRKSSLITQEVEERN
jgi:hypothetical protein